nr:immunoglobulin heavy chain junction region [Homo sapiens]
KCQELLVSSNEQPES